MLVDRVNYEQEVTEFTQAYNSTPQSSTTIPPRALIFRSRTSAIRLPTQFSPVLHDELDQTAIFNDNLAKQNSKFYSDSKNNFIPNSFVVGQDILLKQKQSNKTMTLFDPIPYKIISIKRSMVEISRNGKTYARNTALIQPF